MSDEHAHYSDEHAQLLRRAWELHDVIGVARATLLDAANNDATDEEWARQARAALHVLTMPMAWPSTESEALASTPPGGDE